MKYQTVKLWEIATIQAWWTPNRSKKEYYEWWNIPRLKSWELNDSFSINENEEFITELWMENSSAKLFKKWTLLMAMYWATAWKLWILNIDATTNQAVCSIQNTKWLFDNLYVFYYLFLIRNKIIIDSFWWAQPNISKDYIKNIEIPLPPLETQKAIVAKLDQIFAELDQTKSEIQKNLDNTDELWKSALNQAFQGDWEMKKLGEVCKIERWGSPRPIQEFLTTAENWVNWIKIWDTKTQPKYIEFTQEKIKPEWVKRSRMVYPWDFILSNSMSFGRPYIMKTSWCIHDWRLVLRPDNTVDKEFLYYLLGSDFMYKKFESTASGTGVKNLNIDKVKVIEISIPPLSEQEKIVEHLDQVSKEVKALKSQYQSQLDNLEELKKSVLDKAFRWEMGE